MEARLADASLATDTVIVYFRNVVQAFEARWRQLGGRIVDGGDVPVASAATTASWQNVVTRLNDEDADVIVTSTRRRSARRCRSSTACGRSANNTPILNSWAGDGNYWYAPDPKVSNYYYVTFASAFGDDPVKAVNASRSGARRRSRRRATGGFITGPAAIDGILTAIKRAGGRRSGVALAAQMEKFKNVTTLSGLVSFSKKLHTVFGRTYRVIRVQNNVPRVVGTVKAKVVPKI